MVAKQPTTLRQVPPGISAVTARIIGLRENYCHRTCELCSRKHAIDSVAILGVTQAASASALASPLAVASGLAGPPYQTALAWLPPPHLLCLKALTAKDRLKDSQGGDDSHKYKITCGTPLGSGTYGDVYAGVSQGAVPQQVAIKVCTGDVLREVALLCALSPHPHIITLVDVGLFHFKEQKAASASTGLGFRRSESVV